LGPQKSLRSVLLSTDTLHVLKFHKHPFRGVEEIDYKEAVTKQANKVK